MCKSQVMILDQESLRAYRERWEMVSQIEDAERRSATIEARWRQLNALVSMAKALGLEPEPDDAQSALVYERWNRLREIYLATIEDEAE